MKQGKQRIFWLGMHRVLKKTELAELRVLGYEVFNPAYLSNVFDQSADLTIDTDQPTSLPTDVFDTLLSHNFFYTSVSTHIAEILNKYFDAIIVTIHADWFKSIAEVYNGPIIFRVYGQPWSLSEHLISNGGRAVITHRTNVHIMPFASESVEREHEWFLDLCTEIVPYQISDEVFTYTETWGTGRLRREISVNIPNIEDPYYCRVYESFRAYPQPFFTILGPQRSMPADPRILGSLERGQFLKRLGESAGFFYPYQDFVCYLPPIEAMQIGTPVVYLPGSLLSRFGDPRSPALADDPNVAASKIQQLLDRDVVLASEIIAAQDSIRQRYDRNRVRPAFKSAIFRLLGSPDRSIPPAERPTMISPVSGVWDTKSPTIAIPLHLDGLFVYVDGKPSAFEGIPRVVDVLVDFIVGETNATVIVTCNPASEAVVTDFFRAHVSSGRLFVYVLKIHPTASDMERNLARLEYVAYLNSQEANVGFIFVPHYYLFPEALLVDRPLTLYLPDYFPHLMPHSVFDTSKEKDAANKEIGVALAQKARRILTNSAFTKAYLPDAGLVEPGQSDKVVVAPLPLLGAKRATAVTGWTEYVLQKRIAGRRFLFYPTANRPNKQLAFLIRVLARLRLTHFDLCLVLTCNLGNVPAVQDAVEAYQMQDSIVLSPGASEGEMRWFYENAAALCLTSIAEGNFPPQMLEAFAYGAPVVATRLPTIIETIVTNDELLLCEPLNLADFVDGVEAAMQTRDDVLAKQATYSRRLAAWNSESAFRARLTAIFPGIELT